jgi:hypothetical protein
MQRIDHFQSRINLMDSYPSTSRYDRPEPVRHALRWLLPHRLLPDPNYFLCRKQVPIRHLVVGPISGYSGQSKLFSGISSLNIEA